MRGHTDSLPYNPRPGTPQGMNNWILSSQRAEATRAMLAANGVDPTRFARLDGVADREPFNAQTPYDPRNRRISVTLIDRKSVVAGKSVSVRVDHGGRRQIKKKTNTTYRQKT